MRSDSSVARLHSAQSPPLCVMKIYSISILLAPPSGTAVVMANANDLSSFSFYQRGSADEFMAFLSKTVIERTPQGQRQTVQEQSHVAHVYNRGGAEQLAGTGIACRMRRATE